MQTVNGKESFMRRKDRIDEQCWVDIFEESYFGGRLRRCFADGPGEGIDLSKIDLEKAGGSLIVGPAASVTVHIRRGSRTMVRTLNPKQIVPDVAKLLANGRIQNVVLREVEPEAG
jgi:hypothetical protein